VSGAGTYHGIADVFYQTIHEEGLTALYDGMLPSLLGIIPYCAINYTVYDGLKSVYIKSKQRDPNAFIVLGCGAISSSTAQFGKPDNPSF
jgi:solute carrier family 25 phosphate transporter 23/24/25/41